MTVDTVSRHGSQTAVKNLSKQDEAIWVSVFNTKSISNVINIKENWPHVLPTLAHSELPHGFIHRHSPRSLAEQATFSAWMSSQNYYVIEFAY